MPRYNASAVSYSSYPRSYYNQRSQYQRQTGGNLSYNAWRAYGSPTGTRTTPSSTYTGVASYQSANYPGSYSTASRTSVTNRTTSSPTISRTTATRTTPSPIGQSPYQGQFSIGSIGGTDSIISSGESNSVTGYATAYSQVTLYANPDRAATNGLTGPIYLGVATAERNGSWRMDASTLKNLYAPGTKFTVSASAKTNNGSPTGSGQSNSFSFEAPPTPDPITGNTSSGVKPSVSDLIIGRTMHTGSTYNIKLSETINGTAGNDYFDGNGGQDTFNGFTGADVFDVRDYRGNLMPNQSNRLTNYARIYNFSDDDTLIVARGSTIQVSQYGWTNIMLGNSLSAIVTGDGAKSLSLDSPNVVVA